MICTGATGLEHYRLSIGPKITDEDHRPMDQDSDGVPDEV